MPVRDDVVLTGLSERLETCGAPGSGVRTRRSRGNHRLQIPEGRGRIAVSDPAHGGNRTRLRLPKPETLGRRDALLGDGSGMKLPTCRGEALRRPQCGPAACTVLCARGDCLHKAPQQEESAAVRCGAHVCETRGVSVSARGPPPQPPCAHRHFSSYQPYF